MTTPTPTDTLSLPCYVCGRPATATVIPNPWSDPTALQSVCTEHNPYAMRLVSESAYDRAKARIRQLEATLRAAGLEVP